MPRISGHILVPDLLTEFPWTQYMESWSTPGVRGAGLSVRVWIPAANLHGTTIAYWEHASAEYLKIWRWFEDRGLTVWSARLEADDLRPQRSAVMGSFDVS